MANWKKVIVSGSNAELNDIFASGNITGSNISSSGELYFSSSEANFSNIVVVDITTGKLYRTASSALSVDLVLGTPTDTTYGDGLLPFQTDGSTTINDAIDDINEVLAGLAPSPAPNMAGLGTVDSGTEVNVSFGSDNPIGSYTSVLSSTELTSPDFSTLTTNGNFLNNKDNDDTTDDRLGAFSSLTVINGILNDYVTFNGTPNVNYGDNAFNNGHTGTLKLYVNDDSTPVHTYDLSTTGDAVASSLNANSSGFTNLSATQSAHFPATGNELTVFLHRSGSWQVGTADQQLGWNYAKVIHTVGAVDYTTNYVEWVVDTNSDALSATNNTVTNFNGTFTNRWISGVKYFNSFTADYYVTVNNVYKNVYSDSSTAIDMGNTNTTLVTFDSLTQKGTGVTQADYTTDNTAPTRPLALLNPAVNNCETTELQITGSLKSLTGRSCVTTGNAFTIDLDSVDHPLKTNLSNQGAASLSGLLFDNRTETSTLQSEDFVSESIGRLPIATYANQSAVSTAIGTFDAVSNLASDELLVFPSVATSNSGNGRLVYPTQGVNGGNFSGVSNVPAGFTADYSSATGTRRFMRTFRNNVGSSANGTITITGGGSTIVPSGGTLSSTNIKVRIKFPGTTAFLDLATVPADSDDLQTDDMGCLTGTLDSSISTIAENDFTTLTPAGGGNMALNDYIVVEIIAGSTWTGHISEITVGFS